MIQRDMARLIGEYIDEGKIILVTGARQVGKTTALQEFCKGKKALTLNCDDLDDVQRLEGKTSTELRNLIAPYDIVLIDEAQRIRNIGLILKQIGDLKMDTKVIATGSSSLDLANEIKEPATGRLFEFSMHPLSLRELAADTSEREEQRLLEQRMIYGLYPEAVTKPAIVKRTLNTLANNYLYKDILSYKGIKKPDLVVKLVRLLALQLGSEVSYNELSNSLGVDKETVENYIGLLEKCFIVFRLESYSRNLRNEIKKGKKIYFYDNGIRNAVISNFAPLNMRNDCGQLWENLMICERMKRHARQDELAQNYFWRTHDQKEIDLIEEEDGQIRTFEFKWSAKKTPRQPRIFAETYPNSTFALVTPDNYWEFV